MQNARRLRNGGVRDRRIGSMAREDTPYDASAMPYLLRFNGATQRLHCALVNCLTLCRQTPIRGSIANCLVSQHCDSRGETDLGALVRPAWIAGHCLRCHTFVTIARAAPLCDSATLYARQNDERSPPRYGQPQAPFTCSAGACCSKVVRALCCLLGALPKKALPLQEAAGSIGPP